MISIIQAAGWPIWPLIICSIAALALVVERSIALRTNRIAPATLVDEVLGVVRQGLPGPDVVTKLAANSILGTVLAAGIRAAAVDPGAGTAGVRLALENAGSIAAHRLQRYLNAMATIASAAPLLGLLGTVVGLIEIFGSQAPGGGSNPAQLAHGISVALYNTAFGLMIAIPALLFHRYFSAKAEDLMHDMEQAAERLVPSLSAIVERDRARAGAAR